MVTDEIQDALGKTLNCKAPIAKEATTLQSQTSMCRGSTRRLMRPGPIQHRPGTASQTPRPKSSIFGVSGGARYAGSIFVHSISMVGNMPGATVMQTILEAQICKHALDPGLS